MDDLLLSFFVVLKIAKQVRMQSSASFHVDAGAVGSPGLWFRCATSQRKSCLKACLKFPENIRAIEW